MRSVASPAGGATHNALAWALQKLTTSAQQLPATAHVGAQLHPEGAVVPHRPQQLSGGAATQSAQTRLAPLMHVVGRLSVIVLVTPCELFRSRSVRP
jgi:hypothetical protein